MLVLDTDGRIRFASGEKRESLSERRSRILAEDVASKTATVAADCGRDTSSLEAQLGRWMTSDEVIRRLKLCHPKLVFERSKNYPSLIGIYLNVGDRLIHVCGMEAGINPEFSVRHKKRVKVPDQDLFGTKKPVSDVKWKEIETFDDETRGWRTVLLRLLEAKLITRGDVEKHFRWIPSMESGNWMPNER